MISQLISSKQKELGIMNQLKEFLLEHEEVMYGLLVDFCDEVEEWPDEFFPDLEGIISNVTVGISTVNVNLRTPVDLPWYTSYEKIADKINAIGFGTEVTWNIEHMVELKMGPYTVEIRVADQQGCKLPDEEQNLLAALGKIHVEIPSGSISKSILCTN